jgi:hypothetical protein
MASDVLLLKLLLRIWALSALLYVIDVPPPLKTEFSTVPPDVPPISTVPPWNVKPFTVVLSPLMCRFPTMVAPPDAVRVTPAGNVRSPTLYVPSGTVIVSPD